MIELSGKVSVENLVREYQGLAKTRDDLELLLDSKLAPVKEKMTKIEQQLLEYFDANGITSLKTQYGTPYKTILRKVSIADTNVFFGFIHQTQNYELFQKRVNLTIYEELVNSGVEVPGVKIDSAVKLKIRKP